ncbi:hypothetical protein SNOG_11802 [Parastagonospora nodorum SN15]|uniref:Uncharacterized protein n=1 Tax=Phaeosphaeria nodorum (strain SN15 / ATCC MYA-4574 / FGSC 10173) TaxID=321614 RepID=Q0U8W2_PHANO|nr:hypothetical protein SNOG_11802 [Parastagonospora nodorum SN15]EAT80846.1 hypothetical protein SNOG_11802 [Parastagonospora nodorum SN15]
MRYESRFNGRTQTGIECQQDMLSGDDKSYTRASAVSVHKAERVKGESGTKVETRARQPCPLTGSGPLLAEQTRLRTSPLYLFSPDMRC